MRKEDIDIISALVKKNTRISIGRISQKELKPNNFVSDLFNTFEIKNEKDPSTSAAVNRARMQELVSNSTVPYSGRSRYPNFSIDDFIHDLDIQFTLKPKRKNSTMNKLKAKGVLAVMIIMLFSGCSKDAPPKEKVVQDLHESIIAFNRQNNEIKVNLPILQCASDTLLAFLGKTRHPYTMNILLRNISDINATIEQGKKTFNDNLFQILKSKRELAYLDNSNQQVLLVPSDSSAQFIIGGDTVNAQVMPLLPSDTSKSQ